jgi:hypothetical protein
MVERFAPEVVMHRVAFASAVAFLSLAVAASPTFAQAKQATPPAKAVSAAPTTPAPATPAKWVPPVKGVATIEIVQGPAKVVGKEIVSTVKVKNTSKGSINLLRADQEWYDKGDGKKRNLVTTATTMYRKPFLPGEIIELELRAPRIGNPDIQRIIFSHVNGKVDPKVVKAFQ